MTDATHEQELTPATQTVLQTLYDCDGPVPQTELVEATDLTPGTVSTAVKRLENRGLVTTSPLLTDARQQSSLAAVTRFIRA